MEVEGACRRVAAAELAATRETAREYPRGRVVSMMRGMVEDGENDNNNNER
jgi:hypothetical protein